MKTQRFCKERCIEKLNHERIRNRAKVESTGLIIGFWVVHHAIQRGGGKSAVEQPK